MGSKRIREEDLSDLSREALIERVRQLDAHVLQLKNIIAKQGGVKDGGRESKGKPFDFSRFGKRHIALKVAYLGWDYQGFAAQEDVMKTIETELFSALLKTRLIESRQTSNYHRCGRTDKGVSAFGQVISITLRSNFQDGQDVCEAGKEEIRYCNILNKVLPSEIRILAWAAVPVDFSARFSCKLRTYKYFFPRANLDIKKIEDAGKKLTGKHDYRNFCKMDVGNGVVNYERRIDRVDVKVSSSDLYLNTYDLCELTVTGQAYLWHQIRCMVAVLFLIGQGKEEPSIVDHLLDVKTHPCKPQYSMASEIPLCLYDCQFENVDWKVDEEAMVWVYKQFQELWTNHAIKATMLRKMLKELEKDLDDSKRITNQAESLIQGVKSKVYVPLMKRPTCESLENRMEHHSKRQKRKMEKTEENEEGKPTGS